MELKTCQNCRRLFNYTGFGPQVCPECRDTLEDKFKVVKDYVWEHKGASIPEVSKECDVSEKQIRQWIREERLEFAEGVSGLACEKCGATITIGRFCEKCKREMVSDLGSAIKTEAAPVPDKKNSNNGPRMRFV